MSRGVSGSKQKEKFASTNKDSRVYDLLVMQNIWFEFRQVLRH